MKKCRAAATCWARLLGVLVGFLGLTVGLLGAEEPKRVYDLAAGEAAVTLRQFADLSGHEILFAAEVVRGVHTRAVRGEYTALEAVNRMLTGTRLQAIRDGQSRAIAIRAAPNGLPAPMMRPGDGEALPGDSIPNQASTPANVDSRPMKKKSKNPLVLLGSFLALALAPEQTALAATAPAAAAVATGSLTGTVSNAATGNLLEGARIELVGTGHSTLTDNTGRYVFAAVSSGSHEVVVSYLGLNTTRVFVTLAPAERTVRDFDLTTGIYQLAQFRVVGEREGDALALTAQRNADNVKNIVAMDSFGNLPNMSAGEVLMRLPGVASTPSEEGLSTGFTVRGMEDTLNTVTVDGALLASLSDSRDFQMHSTNVAMFEQLELIKGHTPDKGVDSLGGTVNMKTRSPLNMREKRRITYNATVRIAPSFTEQIPLREQHRAHPLVTLGYQEIFSIFGGERNLGITANLFYSENAVGGYRMTADWQNTMNDPAYVWSYQTREHFNNRTQRNLNIKADYRYSSHSKFSVNVAINDSIEKFRRSYNARAFTGSATTVPNATTSGVIPGAFTDKITQVRPVAAAQIDLVSSGPNSYYVETYRATFAGEHKYGPLEIDYDAGISENHLRIGHRPRGGGIGLTNRISNVGWILDRSASDTFPSLIQTAGPDWNDPANYRPIANGLTKNHNNNRQKIPQARANLLYTLPTAVRTQLKAGTAWREQSAKLSNGSRRWSYLGTSALPADLSARPYANFKTGMRLPRWQVSDFMAGASGGLYPADESLWREDLYYNEQLKYTGTRGARERVTAGYVMAQGRLGREGWLGRTHYLTGVRIEKTETEGWGWVRARFGSTAAQQQADPVGSAQRDYANTYRRTTGDYTKSFPSVHLVHDVNRNLKARASWSTSFGRPAMSNLMPNETVSEANQTVTINNPGLLPQTARNWDFTLEYYFEPVGNLSVGWFRKKIRDYIITGTHAGTVPGGANNGYNGEYEGFTRLQSSNAGTATVDGWEFSYQQQFTFLPGLLKGLSGLVNYTLLETEGNFGGTAVRKTGEVPGFIPRVGNASLSWRYRGFSTRVLYNFTGSHITSFNASSPALNIYYYDRNTVNLGLSYQVRPSLAFTCDVANIFNEKQRFYRGKPDRLYDVRINFVTITVGVSGRF